MDPIELFCHYLTASGSRPGTIGLRRSYLHRLERAVTDLLTATPAQLVDWLSNPAWAPETRKAARSTVTTFYKWAFLFGHITRDLGELMPRVRVPRTLPRPAPTSVVETALAAASDRDRLMILLAAHGGLRRGEIAGLRWANINHDEQTMTILGKGGDLRTVPMVPVVADALTAERGRRAAGHWGTGWRFSPDPRSAWVFPCARYDGPMHPDTVGKTLAMLLGDRWTAHTLRHRFATKAYSGTRDLRAVQELLGHTRPETTARYVAVANDDLRRAAMAATQ